MLRRVTQAQSALASGPGHSHHRPSTQTAAVVQSTPLIQGPQPSLGQGFGQVAAGWVPGGHWRAPSTHVAPEASVAVVSPQV